MKAKHVAVDGGLGVVDLADGSKVVLADIVVGYLADRLCRRSGRGGGPAV